MTTDDLSILADALTFALLVTAGGLIMWAVARATWHRRRLNRTAKVGMSTTALVAVGLAGIAMWPAARDGMNGIPGLGTLNDQAESPGPKASSPDLVPPPPKGRSEPGPEAAPTSTAASSDAPVADTGGGSGPSSGDQATDPPTVPPTVPPVIDSTDPPTGPPTDPPTQPPPTDPPSQPPPTDPPAQPPPTDPLASVQPTDPLLDLPQIDLGTLLLGA